MTQFEIVIFNGIKKQNVGEVFGNRTVLFCHYYYSTKVPEVFLRHVKFKFHSDPERRVTVVGYSVEQS